jgi:hypothetical protein
LAATGSRGNEIRGCVQGRDFHRSWSCFSWFNGFNRHRTGGGSAAWLRVTRNIGELLWFDHDLQQLRGFLERDSPNSRNAVPHDETAEKPIRGRATQQSKLERREFHQRLRDDVGACIAW